MMFFASWADLTGQERAADAMFAPGASHLQARELLRLPPQEGQTRKIQEDCTGLPFESVADRSSLWIHCIKVTWKEHAG